MGQRGRRHGKTPLPALRWPPRPKHLARAAVTRSMLALIAGIGWTKARLLRRQGFRSVWVQTQHGRIHSLQAAGSGRGATWVFIHGYAGQAVDWAGLLRCMRPHCRRLVALDLPGHGRSPVGATGLSATSVTLGALQAIEALLPSDEPMVLVGSSMGGLGAVRCCQHFAGRVVGLVLVSPAGAPLQPQELDALLQLFEVRDMPSALQFVDCLYNNGTPARTLTALGLLAHLGRPSLRDLLTHYRTYPFLTEDELALLPPCLLVWGADDRFFPASSRQFFRRALCAERTEVVSPPRFGHTPFMDHPHQVAQLILAWARRQSGHAATPLLRQP